MLMVIFVEIIVLVDIDEASIFSFLLASCFPVGVILSD